MKVQEVKLVEVVGIGNHKETQPITFFSLDQSEQIKYNSYKVRRDNLESVIKNLKGEERAEREIELRNMFTDLAIPYFQGCELDIAGCFSGYGEDKKTLAKTPVYILFEGNKPFDIGIEVTYWFSTKDENLSCSAHLIQRSSGTLDQTEQQVVYDLLNRTIDGKIQDGINFPFVQQRGAFLYFGSTDFTMPLIGTIREILEKIGPEAVKEMGILYREYLDQKTRDYSDSRIKERVFRRAYEQIMQAELIRAGLSERKLEIVK